MGRIVAIAGGDLKTTHKINQYIVALTKKENPDFLFIGTASCDAVEYISKIHDEFELLGCRVKELSIAAKRYSENEIDFLLNHADIIYVGGGDTAFMMETWKKYGLDRKLKDLYLTDQAVLSGISAGAMQNGSIAARETGKSKIDKGIKPMMTYCGENCCKECGRLPECGGCEQCKGHPFGGSCVAERNKDFLSLKRRLIDEINAFGIEELAVDDLNLLPGYYVNLSYPLENGSTVQFLKENDIYLGNQVEKTDSDRCYGIVANEDFILICEYGCNGSDPEIVMYKRR